MGIQEMFLAKNEKTEFVEKLTNQRHAISRLSENEDEKINSILDIVDSVIDETSIEINQIEQTIQNTMNNSKER